MNREVKDVKEPSRIRVSNENSHYGLMLSYIIDHINDSKLFTSDKICLAVNWYKEILLDQKVYNEFKCLVSNSTPHQPILYKGVTIPEFAKKNKMSCAQAYATLIQKAAI